MSSEYNISTEIPPIDVQTLRETETAAFALGCFWGAEAQFGCLPGIVYTRVGYAGGTKENPTYHNLGDHTETVQVVYDPSEISYEELQQHSELMKEFQVYSDVKDFIESTAATRVNGYIGGCGTITGLQQEIDKYGLSEEGKELLLRIVQQRS